MNWDVKTPALKPVMNKTETEFSMILEAMKRRGEILRWRFQALTLKWGEGKAALRYTPDFYVVRSPTFKPVDALDMIEAGDLGWSPLFIEVKGGFIREDAMVKFKAARAEFAEFAFEMHQKKAGAWRRVL